MTLIDTNKLTDEVLQFHQLIQKRTIKSLLKSLIRRPSFSVIKALVKMTKEHENYIEDGNLDVTSNHTYFPSDYTIKKYVSVLRKLFDDVYIPFNEESTYIPKTNISSTTIAGVPVDWVRPLVDDPYKVVVHIHGGGYVVGGPEIYHSFAARLASMSGVPVLLPDYRLAPEHPFPAGLDDCLRIYEALIDSGYDSENIIISGDSAGGGMALALILKLKDEGLPLPGGVMPISAYADLTFSGESMLENVPTDIVVADFPLYFFAKCYVDPVHIPLDYYLVSPYFGDYEGLPPMLMIASNSEMLVDDTIRIAEKALEAGVDTEIILANDMPHVYPCLGATMDWEEVDRAFISMTQFVIRQTITKRSSVIAQ